MVDPAGEPPPPPGVDPAGAATPQAGRPSEPGGPRVYELPTPRRVVASGLGLALASTGDLRKASVYVGLLVLGAFGPSIVALLLILGRLGDAAGDVFASLFLNANVGGPAVPPALEAAILVVLFEALAGLLLFVAISIDAQVIAISILGSRAGDRPLRLWEAIIRARQTFWRMAGSGTLVGIVSAVIQGLIVAAIDGFSRSPEASTALGGILATIVVAPLAYVSTSVVLGDVGAMEALSRSWRLFQARRLLAVVVVLFTLVTSAIHLFAFGAGVDLVARAADLLHVSLTEGAFAFLAAAVLILAAVVAYGSLAFTVGAIVSAPQVAGFLGLTFFSGGLDRARSAAPRPPPGFRYVTRPMLITFVVLGGLVAVEVPAINSISMPGGGVSTPTSTFTTPTSTFTTPTARPSLGASGTPPPARPTPPSIGTTPPVAGLGAIGLLEALAGAESGQIRIGGDPAVVRDVPGDAAVTPDAPPGTTAVDLLRGEYGVLPAVPAWLLDSFACGMEQVICPVGGSSADAFRGGAMLFVHGVDAGIPEDVARTFAVVLQLDHEAVLISGQGEDPFHDASRVFLIRTGPEAGLVGFQAVRGELQARVSRARARWTGSEVFTLIPLEDLRTDPIGWDLAVFAGSPSPTTRGLVGDTLRAKAIQPVRPFDLGAEIRITDDPSAEAP